MPAEQPTPAPATPTGDTDNGTVAAADSATAWALPAGALAVGAVATLAFTPLLRRRSTDTSATRNAPPLSPIPEEQPYTTAVAAAPGPTPPHRSVPTYAPTVEPAADDGPPPLLPWRTD
ncbi:hypothetical protein [Streptomyces sp. NPDC002133]|uniref:hypothetical protein n=1 Tax=Streptomyces sp. NPDC002133 TaxID=3154409 RepID=UPI003317EA2F